MFYVKYGEKYLHNPSASLFLPTATLEKELNSSDIFSFTISVKHPVYSSLKERDRDNSVLVLSDNNILFRGEITSISDDFYMTKTVECRGELGYLNDSVVKPYSTLSTDGLRIAPSTINGYFEFLITEHNNQVSSLDSNKKFVIGVNKGASLDSNNYIYRSDTTFPSVGETIKSKILDSIGGYLTLSYNADGTRTINLLDNFNKDSDVNNQLIDFGVNLIDFIKSENSTNLATYLIPMGDAIPTVPTDSTSTTSTTTTEVTTNLSLDSSVLTPMKKYHEYLKKKYNESVANYNEASTNYTASKKKYDDAVAAGSASDVISDAKKEMDADKDTLDMAKTQRDTDKETRDSYATIVSDATTNTTDGDISDGYRKTGYFIYDKEAVKRYGWVGKSVTYSEVTLASNLIKNAKKDLEQYSKPDITIEIKAVDLALIKPDYKNISVGQFVRVRSKPHKFDSYMLCSKLTYDLNKPDNNTFTLGTVYKTFTSQSNSRINKLNQTISSSDINTASIISHIQSMINNTTYYISESGELDDWRYTKWNNGDLECWNTVRGISVSSDSDEARTINLPSGLFAKVTKPTATIVSTTGPICYTSIIDFNSSSIEYYITSTSDGDSTIDILFNISGKWK